MDILGKMEYLPSYKNWLSSDTTKICSRIEKPRSCVSPAPMKRSRPLNYNIQNPCCQVEGCNLDLKTAKDYHRRHRICDTHSKSPRVIVAGMERRFCQQCSRFHALSEFDANKRSCRRRLFDHNARRRRAPPDSIQFSSTRASSTFQDIIKTQPNFYINGSGGAIGGTLCFSSNEMQSSGYNFQMNSSRNFMDQCSNVWMASYERGPDFVNAPSLLSTNSWSLNHDESGTMDGFFFRNPGYVMHRTAMIDFTPAETHNVGMINSSHTRS